MNRLFFTLIAVIVLAACSESEKESKEIILANGTSLSQTLYADETQKPEGIKFTATAPWTASVNEVIVTKATGSEVEWLTLSEYEGKAGEQTLNINLKTNLTGIDRKAEIKIVSGGTLVSIVVEQKALTKDGNRPKPERPAPSGTGTLTNETTGEVVKLIKVTHTIYAQGIVRIIFIGEKTVVDGKEYAHAFTADFCNPLENGGLKAGVYTVQAINLPPYPVIKEGECGWQKSGMTGYGETGVIKVEYSEHTYTFTMDLKTGAGEQQHTLKGTFTGVPEYLNEEVKVKGVTLSESQKTLEFGGIFDLEATILPTDATDKRVTWESSNTGVATVDENGRIAAVAAGETMITAKSVEGGKSATCRVTVSPAVAVQNIKVEPTTLTLLKGEYHQTVKVTVLPENAYNKEYTWVSSNKAVADYTGKGVEAKTAGTTTITFTTKDGSKTATLTVKVEERESFGNGTMKIVDNSGKYDELNFTLVEVKQTIEAKDRTELKFLSDSGNPILQLKFFNPLSGGRLAAGTYDFNQTNNAGTALNHIIYSDIGYLNGGSVTVAISGDTYTFTMNNIPTTNGRTVTCSYTGELTYTNEYHEVTSVQLSKSALSLNLGESERLIATVNPTNAFNKNVTWGSDNPNIASVSNGYVYAHAVGTATITVTTEDGAKTASCVVTVNAHPAIGDGTFTNNASQSVSIKRAMQRVNEKDPKEIILTFYTETAAEEALSFTLIRGSSDTGALRAGSYATIAYLSANELGVKYSNPTGTVTVALAGDNYTITLDLTTENGIKITGSYSGKLAK